MATTPHLTLTLVEQAQAQKEVTVNEALKRLDAILNTGAKDKDLTAPPGAPAAGDVYLVAASATGAWAGHDKEIAYYDQTWKFIAPKQGVTLWVNDEDLLYRYDGAAWAAVTGMLKKELYALPGDLRPSSSSGCAVAATLAMGAGKPDIVTLDFDPAAQEYAEFSVPMPGAWNLATVTAQYLWSHAATATNFGVVWSLQAVAFGDGDSLSVAFGTAIEQADTGGAADTLYLSPETPAITIAGTPAKRDMAYLRVSRVATHGSDTLAVDARLHAVRLYITVNALTDA